VSVAIRAVVFDIGGVLECTPPLGMAAAWESRLGLGDGALDRRLADLWAAGATGTVTLDEVHRAIATRLGWDAATVQAFMGDLWTEYLGTLNVELTGYFAGLRPRFRTGILSNSFVGARERECARYHFDELADVIVYSHEVGLSKPDPRVYELTWQRLGVQPEEMVFLDDVEPNVAAAAALGVRAVLFTDTARAMADLDALLCVGGSAACRRGAEAEPLAEGA
jgi:epoxide hydrolase-like predicted phosphatase